MDTATMLEMDVHERRVRDSGDGKVGMGQTGSNNQSGVSLPMDLRIIIVFSLSSWCCLLPSTPPFAVCCDITA